MNEKPQNEQTKGVNIESAKNALKAVQLFKRVFENEDGEEVLKILKEQFLERRVKGLRVSGFDVDPNKHSFNSGQADVVLNIMNHVEADTVALIQMIG